MRSELKTKTLPFLVLVFCLAVTRTPCLAQSGDKAELTSETASAQTIPSRETSAAQVLSHFTIKAPAVLADELTNRKGSDPKDNTGNANSANTGNNNPGSPTPGGRPQLGNFSDRTISRDRNAPKRESLQAIKIVNHVNGLFGGYEQGAGF